MKNRLLLVLLVVVPCILFGQSGLDELKVEQKKLKTKLESLKKELAETKAKYQEINNRVVKAEYEANKTEYWGIARMDFFYGNKEGYTSNVMKGDTVYFSGKNSRGSYRPVNSDQYMMSYRFSELNKVDKLPIMDGNTSTSNSFYSAPSKKSTYKSGSYKSSSSRSSSSYRSSGSSYCGAKNRSKYGYCRRKVKGGGRCYQHGG